MIIKKINQFTIELREVMIIFCGSGLLNTLINKIPFEAHIPGYQFCGPGTKLKKRLKRGDCGINPLDSACKDHDIAYSNNLEIKDRNLADKVLANKAWSRVLAKDSTLGEKIAAFTVGNIMNIKSKVGMGLDKRKSKARRTKRKKKNLKVNFEKVVNEAKKCMDKNSEDAETMIKTALSGAKKIVRKNGGKKKIKIPRILPTPVTGGALPLIPLFAGLSALGTLANGIIGISKAVNDVRLAKSDLKNTNNKHINIPIGKGLYLKPYKFGNGMKLKIHKQLIKKKLRKSKNS